MAQNLSTTILPSPSSSMEVKSNAKTISFGNGYQQDIASQINSQYEVWSLEYELLTIAQRNTIKNVLLAAGTWDIINWTAPGSTAKKYKRPLDSSIKETRTGDRYNLSFQLKQVFA